MNASEKCVVGSWVVFVVYWIVSAPSAKPMAERQRVAGILAHRLPIFLGALAMLWPRPPHPFEARIVPHPAMAGYFGAGFCVLGLSLAIWSRKTLGRNWSSTVTFKQEHELVERGPYRFVRHPIYTGMLLMCFGSAWAGGRLFSFLGLPLLFTGLWIKLRQEEALLTRHFPNEYPAYAKRVKALIPFVL